LIGIFPRMASMRIAVNALCAAVGGARTHLLRILPRLLDLGPSHEFTVFVPREDVDAFRVAGAANARWVEVPVSGLDTKGRLLWENLSLPGLLRRGRFDVELSPANLSHFPPAVPRVIIVHNVLPFYPALCAAEALRSRVRLRLLRWATRHFVRRAEGTIFLSRAGRADVLEGSDVTPRQESVIPHGVDPAFGRMDPAQARREVATRFGVTDPYVLYASHLYRYKRVESLIDAAAAAGPSLRAHRVLIAGAPFDGAYAAELGQRAAAASVADRVLFLGAVDYPTLSLLHAGAEALTFLSVCENCPNLVLEALNAGGPLVLADRPVHVELAGEAALFVDPADPRRVAEVLERALTDRGLRDELRLRARARAQAFSWDEAAADTLALLERVGGARATRAA